MAFGGYRRATRLATCLALLAYASGAHAFDEHRLGFQTLDVPEMKQDAAARLYREEMGRWPTALRRAGMGSRLCIDGLTITMLDQKESDADADQWVVFLVSCQVQSS